MKRAKSFNFKHTLAMNERAKSKVCEFEEFSIFAGFLLLKVPVQKFYGVLDAHADVTVNQLWNIY